MQFTPKTHVMTIKTLLLALITTVMATPAVSDQASFKYQSTSAQRFLQKSRVLNLPVKTLDPVYVRICEAARQTLPQLGCPDFASENPTHRNFLPPAKIAADLPNLRTVIAINRVEHQPVSGEGIFQDWITWKLTSNTAPDTGPYEIYGLPIQLEPGAVWDIGDIGQPISHGFVANGCSPTTEVDLALTTQIYYDFDPETYAEVTLHDTIVGNGYYHIAYTIQAADGDSVSDFIFSGYAKVYCTAASE